MICGRKGGGWGGGGEGVNLSASGVGGEPAVGGAAVPHGVCGAGAIDGEVGGVVHREHHALSGPVHRPRVEPLPCVVQPLSVVEND